MKKTSSLFKVKGRKAVGKIPTVLPNIALFGNEVRNYNVVYTDTPAKRSNKNDINIPKWIATANNKDRELLVQAGIYVKLLMSDMKFQKKDETILYLSQMLVGIRYARKRIHEVLKDMGGEKRYEYIKNIIDNHERKYDIDDTDEAIRELLERKELTDFDVAFFNEYKQYRYWRKPVGLQPNEHNVQLTVWRAIRELYEDKDISKFQYNLTKQFALYGEWRYNMIKKDDVEKIVASNVPFNIPIDIRNQDVKYIQQLIDQVNYVISDTASYVREFSSVNQRWKYSNSLEKYIVRTWKLSSKQLRYRVNRTYKYLMGDLSKRYYGGRGKTLAEKGLPSDNYKPTPANSKEAEESPDGLSLPNELSDELKEKIMQEADRNHERQRQYIDHRTNEGGVHGKARKHKFSPDAKIHKAIRELRKRNNDTGVVPKNMHRLTTDRKVFQSRKTVAGGSMMIDCSGSMGFYSDDVEEIVNLLPASWIAGYVGYHGKHDGYDGDIRIIADNGSMSKDAIEKLNQYGANSVDLEALKLLAEQPEPRIWVSDQQVIGVDEHTGRSITLSTKRVLEIERFMLKNNIIPIENVDMVKEVAKQLSVKK